MLTEIHLASKPVGLGMNLSKTKVMLNESATTSTVAVDGNTIEKVDRYVYLGKTVTQAWGSPSCDHEAHCTGMGRIQQGGQHHEEQEG